MPITVRSFAKINIGLIVGPPSMREDGFHELRTLYETIALHDTISMTAVAAKKSSIEIKCSDQNVPTDKSNTCYQAAERTLRALKISAKVTIAIDKQLPVQGGLGAASSNAAATIIGLERVLKKTLVPEDRLRLAQEVGSDVPLFLVGGAVLGVGRGEEVFPLPDLPELNLVIATPKTKVSTPKAFADWDKLFRDNKSYAMFERVGKERKELTVQAQSDKLSGFSRELYAWLNRSYFSATSGVPARGGNRAEALLLDLVRTGIENDFEQVVFPQFPELRGIKRALERQGSSYASLSGSGSSVYGLFSSRAGAVKAAKRLNARGIRAQATKTISREQYWATIASVKT
jgi:4-diphosphocytidyl-2-C-methyl-D-erythritol kinase